MKPLVECVPNFSEGPRAGAMDVCPFAPISGVPLDDCVALARRLGERVAGELGVPVYFYEAAATRPERKALPDVRKGGDEGLKAEIATNPDRRPDVGPAKLH